MLNPVLVWKEWLSPVGARHPFKTHFSSSLHILCSRVSRIPGVKSSLTCCWLCDSTTGLQLVLAELLEPHPTSWGAPNRGLLASLALTFTVNPVTCTLSITKHKITK